MMLSMKFNKNQITNAFWAIALIIFFILKAPTWYHLYSLNGVDFPKHHLLNIINEPRSFPIYGQKGIYLFWATWCAPCSLELKRINRMILNKEMSNRHFFAINTGEEIDIIRKKISSENYAFQIFIDRDQLLQNELKINSTPTIFFVDENGKIQKVLNGISPLLEFHIKHFLD